MRGRERERGAALLTVLLLVAVIAVMAATALERLRLSTRLGANAVALDRARGFAGAAEVLATTRITALLRQSPDKVTLAGGWSGRAFGLPVPGGVATARVSDGGNCFNLNSLAPRGSDGAYRSNDAAVAQLATLTSLLRVPDGAAIAAAAADWIDSDGDALPGGAEDGAYSGYRTGGTAMASVTELRAVKGVTPEAYRLLAPWLCALPTGDPASINVDTLAAEQAPLVAALFGGSLGVEQVRGALLRRPPYGWDSAEGFLNQLSQAGAAGSAAGLDARRQLGVKTTWFALQVDVTAGATGMTERGLIDARALPVRLVSRQWGEAP